MVTYAYVTYMMHMVDLKPFLFIIFLPLTVCLLFQDLRFTSLLSFAALFKLTAVLLQLTACIHLSSGNVTHDFLLKLVALLLGW